MCLSPWWAAASWAAGCGAPCGQDCPSFESKVYAAGDDTFHQVLGTDGYWDFYFQGCSAFATETIALDDPPGGPFANAYEPPTGYKCRMSIDGSADGPTPWYSGADPQVGSVADTGGLIFFQSSSSWSSDWPNPTTWRITCDPI